MEVNYSRISLHTDSFETVSTFLENLRHPLLSKEQHEFLNSYLSRYESLVQGDNPCLFSGSFHSENDQEVLLEIRISPVMQGKDFYFENWFNKGYINQLDNFYEVVLEKRLWTPTLIGGLTTTDRISQEKIVRLLKETEKIANIGSWELDINSETLYWSEEVYKIHELPNNAAIELEKAINFYREDYRPLITDAINRAMEEKSGWDLECILVTSKGNEVWVRAIGKVILEQGEVTGLHGLFQDINHHKRLQIEATTYSQKLANLNAELEEKVELRTQEIEQKNVLLEKQTHDLKQFAFVASHDLQEPLRVITSYLSILQEDCEGQFDENGQLYIDKTVNAANRMRKLINDLLAYSRVGKKERIREPVDLEQVLGDVLEDLEIGIKAAQATITHDPLPNIKGDQGQLKQLFQNLIGNALKYKKKDLPAEIDITVVDQGSSFRFGISDNGIGIAPEYKNRVFEIFQRLHTKSAYSGTGIGLAICRRIVDEHDGEIWLKSELGEGCTFFFELPVTN